MKKLTRIELAVLLYLHMQEKLRGKLERIAHVFTLEDLQSLSTSSEDIRRYYTVNKIPYSLLHSRQNYVHMGISRDGHYSEADLTEHAKFVESYVLKHNASNILELATGRGANSIYLATRHQSKNFYGVDLSEIQLSFARKSVAQLSNLHVALTNYHNLSDFADDSIDVVFVVEALCYGDPVDQVLREVRRVLTPGGHFIVYDGYRGSAINSEDEQVAMEVTERSMAVTAFLSYASFKEKVNASRLFIVEEENLSKCIMPTLRRFDLLAERFFRYPILARLVAGVFPYEFTYNAVAGMLMLTLIETEVFEYRLTVMQK